MSEEFFIAALAGFVAAMIDGALGMGFGPTSSSILLTTGLPPSLVSTVVNIAKVASGLAAGISHWRFRNIDRRLVLKLAIPGCIGAGIGVTVLANVDGKTLRPILAAVLLLVGLRIAVRFGRSRPTPAPVRKKKPAGKNRQRSVQYTLPPDFDDSGVKVVATMGGVTNGLVGAWGPVVTPFLLHRGLPPRFAIGTVNTAEVAVALVSATSLLASMGSAGLNVEVVVGMLCGGVLAAPLAAWSVRFMPARGMGLAVALLLIVTSLRELGIQAGLGDAIWFLYAATVLLMGVAAILPHLSRREVVAPPPEPATPPPDSPD